MGDAADSDTTRSDPVGERHATWLELFFDLVFVITVGRLAARFGHHLDVHGLLEFLGLFIPVWWIWVGHTVYATRFDRDDTVQRLLTFGQMLAVAALALHVGKEKEAAEAARAVVVCYLAARVCLLGLYTWTHVIRRDARVVTTMALVGYTVGGACWAVSLAFEPPAAFLFWGLGILADLAAPLVTRLFARLPHLDTAHFPERFGLLVIIVLGETILAAINGLAHVHWNAPAIGAAVLGFGLAITLWWMYFSYATRASFVCTLGTGRAYIFLHLPVTLSIIVLGLSVESTILAAGGGEASGHGDAAGSGVYFLCGATVAWLASFAALQVLTLPPRETARLQLSFGTAVAGAALLGVAGAYLQPVVTLAILTVALATLATLEAKFIRRLADQATEAGGDRGGRVVREYQGEGFRVSFDPLICQHVGDCLRCLPAVFDVSQRPWIRTQGAPAEEIEEAVRKCPSGALQFVRASEDAN